MESSFLSPEPSAITNILTLRYDPSITPNLPRKTWNDFKPSIEKPSIEFIEKSIENKRPYLNVNKIDLEKISNKIIQYTVNRNKEKEIDDNILRQTLFLFNLELWYQIFIERDDMKNPNLALNSFV